MKFKFKAQKPTGEIYEAEREAVDRFSLYRDLKKDGHVVLSARAAENRRAFKFGERFKFLGRVGMYDKIIFARNLGGMLEAGLALSRALSVLERESKKKKLKGLFASLNETIRKGRTLSEGLSGFPSVFSPLFVSMVKAGEESGSLSSSLKMAAFQMENVYNLERKVRGAMMYPLVILLVMVVIGALLLVYVVPNLAATFKEFGSDLPYSTRLVIGVSDFLRGHSVASLIILAAAVGLARFLFKTGFGKRAFDFSALRVPIIGRIVKEVNTARTARTLSSLLRAGVPVVSALSITGTVLQNHFYKQVLQKAEKSVETGSLISAVFMESEELYPPFLSEMTAVGEETGKLSEMLGNVADFFEKEVEQKTKDMSSVIEPFLMVAIGVAVGFFAFSMITPMYSLVSAIN